MIQVSYPSIDRLLNIVSSKYELVHIAARRSKEMTKDEHYQLALNQYKCSKNIGRALEEILEGKIKVSEKKESVIFSWLNISTLIY